MDTRTLLLVVIIICSQSLQFAGARKAGWKRMQALARKWAPRVWLHKAEKFYPSSVGFFLRHVKVVDSTGNAIKQPPILTVRNLPAKDSKHYLTTKEELKCPNCTNIPMLRGQIFFGTCGPTVYAIVRKTNKETRDIFYWFFYPYNRGKTVCKKIKIPLCGGKSHQFGHHVGDWEHISIRVIKGKAKEIYVAFHSSGTKYSWNGTHFHNGNDVVTFHKGHPVIYSAKGSHGSWVTPGRHVYLKVLGIELFDETSPGTAWDTWRHLSVIRFHKDHLRYHGRNAFMRFQGFWGNKEQHCPFKKLVGTCTLDWGPRSLNSRPALQNSKVLGDQPKSIQTDNDANVLENALRGMSEARLTGSSDGTKEK